VQEHRLNPISMKILEGGFKPGDKIKVTADGDELNLQQKRMAP
jgi:ATP-dependent Clp protease ATP-binding subunit ClpA